MNRIDPGPRSNRMSNLAQKIIQTPCNHPMIHHSLNSSKARIIRPYPLTRTLSVKNNDSGRFLIDYLCERFPYISAEKWKDRIGNKHIWLDDGPAEPGSILKANQIIFHHSPDVKEPSVPDSVRIVNEGEDWLIAYKPAPMPMHQGGRYFKNTLSYILDDMGHRNLSIIHRLDSVTSGLVLFAKNKTAAQQLQAAFSSGRVTKWYYALVSGKPALDKMIINAPIQRKKGFIFECGHYIMNGKPAKTIIEKVRANGETTLVKCYPVTGRTHQIRLHLQHAGIPVIDDPIYGSNGDISGISLQNRSIKLQSSGLILADFSIHEEIDVPEEWLSVKEV